MRPVVLLALDGVWIAGLIAVVLGLPPLAKRLGWFWIRWPSLAKRVLYVFSLSVVWIFTDLGLMPRWAAWLAQAGIIVAYLIAPDDNDNDRRKRRGRLRATWHARKRYLAHGIQEPAR